MDQELETLSNQVSDMKDRKKQIKYYIREFLKIYDPSSTNDLGKLDLMYATKERVNLQYKHLKRKLKKIKQGEKNE